MLDRRSVEGVVVSLSRGQRQEKAHTGIAGARRTPIHLRSGVEHRDVEALNLFFFSSRRRHTRLQGDWSSDVCSSDLVATLVRSHHERFDGAGFPDGLKGKDIPIGARIIAVADFYDDLMIGHLSSKPLNCAEARTLKIGRAHV